MADGNKTRKGDQSQNSWDIHINYNEKTAKSQDSVSGHGMTTKDKGRAEQAPPLCAKSMIQPEYECHLAF